MIAKTITMCTLSAMASAAGATDWPTINAAARAQAKTPIRAGVPGERPFWNAHAKAFIHSPAFEFSEVEGAKGYRFSIVSDAAKNTPPCPSGASPLPEGGLPPVLPPTERGVAQSAGGSTSGGVDGSATWLAPHPWLPLDAAVWDTLAPGYYTLRVEALDADGTPLAAPPAERRFYRAAVFHGPYPAAPRDYREAAARVYASVYNLPHVQAWLDSDDPPPGYDLYCYPAKILSSMIRALARFACGALGDRALPAGADRRAARDRALAIARKMADWLIEHSQPEDAPLAHFPPTYWGDRRDVAVKYAGQNMLLYPAHAALAYFDLAAALDCAPGVLPQGRAQSAALAGRYREAALDIARTYVRLQGEDGTWPLKVLEKDGSPVRANRLVPSRYLLGMFDRAIEACRSAEGETADFSTPRSPRPAARASEEAAALADSRDRAFAYVLDSPATTWNWDGQFEDMDPMPPYQNLQKGVAVDTALRLFALGRNAEACELVDWCEDQFTVWSDPIHHMDWQHWKTPTALEQYDYYTPIDASMGDMVRAFSAAYKATGNALYHEKAKAIADNLVRNQRADGTIPTYFDSRGGSDWVNCMVYSASCLELAADMESPSAGE